MNVIEHLPATYVDIFNEAGDHKGNRWVSGNCRQEHAHQNCNGGADGQECECPCHSPSEKLFTATML